MTVVLANVSTSQLAYAVLVSESKVFSELLPSSESKRCYRRRPGCGARSGNRWGEIIPFFGESYYFFSSNSSATISFVDPKLRDVLYGISCLSSLYALASSQEHDNARRIHVSNAIDDSSTRVWGACEYPYFVELRQQQHRICDKIHTTSTSRFAFNNDL